MSAPSSPSRAPHSVTKLDDTIVKLFSRPQRQWDVQVTSRDERNAISDEYWHDANDELVDRLGVKKRTDDFAATHQPDVFALTVSKPIHERANGLVREFNGWRSIFGTRAARENDGSTRGIERCSHAQTRFVGLPANHHGID
jgi:hypothetical protein